VRNVFEAHVIPESKLGQIECFAIRKRSRGIRSSEATRKKKPARAGFWFGGGGENRTRVRKPYTNSSTYLARLFDLTLCTPTGGLASGELPMFNAIQSNPE
jgi:hypothetical protein